MSDRERGREKVKALDLLLASIIIRGRNNEEEIGKELKSWKSVRKLGKG